MERAIEGFEVTTPAGVATAAQYAIESAPSRGRILGCTIAENYELIDLAKLKITLIPAGADLALLQEVPASQLIPGHWPKGYFPFGVNGIEPGKKLNATVRSTTANAAVANPVVVNIVYGD